MHFFKGFYTPFTRDVNKYGRYAPQGFFAVNMCVIIRVSQWSGVRLCDRGSAVNNPPFILPPSQPAALEPCRREKRGDLPLETTCQPRKVAKTGGRFCSGKREFYTRWHAPFRNLNLFYWDFMIDQSQSSAQR